MSTPGDRAVLRPIREGAGRPPRGPGGSLPAQREGEPRDHQDEADQQVPVADPGDRQREPAGRLHPDDHGVRPHAALAVIRRAPAEVGPRLPGWVGAPLCPQEWTSLWITTSV